MFGEFYGLKQAAKVSANHNNNNYWINFKPAANLMIMSCNNVFMHYAKPKASCSGIHMKTVANYRDDKI